MRIVSLIASATEIVSALGCVQQLVGRSHECDYPSAVLRLPVCTAPKFDTHGSSAEIDRLVKATLQDALAVYSVDRELLASLQPDVIITQTQCDVCAVSLRDVEQALCSWLTTKPQLVALAPNSLADVWQDIQHVAVALGVEQRGKLLVEHLRERMERIAARAKPLPHPSVACLEWLDPLMAAGNWMPELVALAGGVNLFGAAGKHSPWMSWEQLCERDPDLLLALPCGFDLERTRKEMMALVRHPDWSRLHAVRTGRVFLTDGNQFFNRPGPRLVESLEILAEIFHPAHFQLGHHGIGWEALAS